MNMTKKVETETIKGKIVFSMLPYQQRVELVKSVYFSGKKQVGEDETSEQLDIGIKINELVAKQVKHIELVYKDGELDAIIDSIEVLGMFQEGVSIINDIGQTILNGYAMGKEKVMESGTPSL